MSIRTSTRSVTFRRPFFIAGIEKQLPAGVYVIETDEKLLENVSFLAYQRVSTVIHLPPKNGYSTTLTVDPNELDSALKRDHVLEGAEGHVLHENENGPWNGQR